MLLALLVKPCIHPVGIHPFLRSSVQAQETARPPRAGSWLRTNIPPLLGLQEPQLDSGIGQGEISSQSGAMEEIQSIRASQKLIEERRDSTWLCVEPLMHVETVMIKHFPAVSRTFGKCKERVPDLLIPLVTFESVSPQSQDLVHLCSQAVQVTRSLRI